MRKNGHGSPTRRDGPPTVHDTHKPELRGHDEQKNESTLQKQVHLPTTLRDELWNCVVRENLPDGSKGRESGQTGE
jgi:hypothetical protein